MFTDSDASSGEVFEKTHNSEAPLRFSFDLTPSAVERTRLLSLIPYPLVRGYLWLRGWVAVGVSALERSFKYLLVGLLGFIAGYSSYNTPYATHLRAYWQPHVAPVAAVSPAAATPDQLRTPIAVDAPPLVADLPDISVEPTSKASVPPPVAAPKPKPVPRLAPPSPEPPVIAAAPTPATAEPQPFVGEARDPSIPLFNLNRSPGEPLPDTAPVATYDERPVEERTLEHRQEAAATDRLILYYFSAEWCLPCKVMESEVFTDPAVSRTLQNQYVFIKSDVESLDGYELKQHYGVESLPGFIMMDRYGRELDRASAAMPLSRFRSFLRAKGAVLTAAKRSAPRLR